MKYSFVFVLCLGALVMQCSCRPQMDVSSSTPAPPETSSPAAESVMAGAETATEIAGAGDGEQVVFDEGEQPVVGASNDEEVDAPTTSQPDGEESQQDEATTTLPCTGGDDCNSPVSLQDAASTDEAPAAPSDDAEVTTMPPNDS